MAFCCWPVATFGDSTTRKARRWYARYMLFRVTIFVIKVTDWGLFCVDWPVGASISMVFCPGTEIDCV